MYSLRSFLPQELAERMPEVTLQEARRIVALAHRYPALPAITPAGLRRRVYLEVRRQFSAPTLELVAEEPSSLDPFVKYCFVAPDGAPIETVRIPLERPGRFVVCVSSQVGCGMGCTFCGTARLGLHRNLAVWEMVEQVHQVRRRLPAGTRVHGVVFQGMGEPLGNLEAVMRAVRIFSEPCALAIDARNITVCTVGRLGALRALLDGLPKVRLTLSVGSAIAATRAELMPSERSQPLARLLEVLAAHTRATGIAPVLSYTLLGAKNDTERDLEALLGVLSDFVSGAGMAPRVSLVTYNPLGPEDRWCPAPGERLETFRAAIGALGIPVVRRYSGGADVGAACGQLGLRWIGKRLISAEAQQTDCG